MNTFGNRIKITVFGESHAEKIGVIIEGLPSGFAIDTDRVQRFLDRRAPGKNEFSTPRKETDTVCYTSGLCDGKTTGEALTAEIYNSNTRSGDYDELKYKMRPSHADYPAKVKYGMDYDMRGGGKFSGRMTAPICIAGAILLQMLEEKGVFVGAHIASVGSISDDRFDTLSFDKEYLLSAGEKDFPVLSDEKGDEMKKVILSAKENLDSVGGSIECMAIGVPAGVGEHMFMGLENVIASAVFAIPAVKGIEFGMGFESTRLVGSQNNDEYYFDENKNIRTKTNNAGGIVGGMSTGMPIAFTAAVKPTPSIARQQNTVDIEKGENTTLCIKGRHDPCIVQRAVPCMEAVMAMALGEFLL